MQQPVIIVGVDPYKLKAIEERLFAALERRNPIMDQDLHEVLTAAYEDIRRLRMGE